MDVTWAGHATVLLELDGMRILTDPLLGRHAGLLRRPLPRPGDTFFRSIDAVLISHLHHDHAELRSLRMVADAPVFAGSDNATWLSGRGLTGVGLELRRWRRLRRRDGSMSGVEVMLVPADHHSRPMPHRPNGAHGFLIRSDDQTVYFAGDTAVQPEMAELVGLAGRPVTLALLPIGGWGPKLSPGHMGPAEAARACALIRPQRVLPIHFGSLHPFGFHLFSLAWMVAPARHFRAEMRHLPQCQVVVARPGSMVSLS